MRNLHAEITAKILGQLKTGVAPWRKPWSEKVAAAGSVMPRNAVTGRPYSGVNIMLLWGAASVAGWGPQWLTFKQAKEAGGTVRKGEKGEMVIFVKRIIVDDKERPGEKRAVGFLRSYVVFNVAQCDGLAIAIEPREHKPVNLEERSAELDAFVEATGIKVREQGARACYSPVLDQVDMPAFAAFKSAHDYYATEFHELGHATGHKDRLNRDLRGRFGDRAYAAEELIAELTSAFVCAEWGIDMGEAPASYLASWTRLLEDKETAIVTAASAASKAVEWMRGAASAEDADLEDEPARELEAA